MLEHELVKARRPATKVEDLTTKHFADIKQFKHLDNVKVLKNMLKSNLRSKGILTGSRIKDKVIADRLNEALTTVHNAIDCGEIKTYGEVNTLFWQLFENP